MDQDQYISDAFEFLECFLGQETGTRNRTLDLQMQNMRLFLNRINTLLSCYNIKQIELDSNAEDRILQLHVKIQEARNK